MNYGANVAISWESVTLRFPPLFTNDFGPAALQFPQPSLTTVLSYGEDVTNSSIRNGFRIARPTIELPLDEILRDVDPDRAVGTPYGTVWDTQLGSHRLSGSNGSAGEDIDMNAISSSVSSSALANANDPDITVPSMFAAFHSDARDGENDF